MKHIQEKLKGIRPVWAEIDLDVVAWNIKQIRNLIGSDVELMAVVKADGYGHGDKEVARVALNNGADRLAVAFVKEGKKLRKAGLDAPILMLSPIYEHQISELVKYNLTPTIFTLEMAKAISQYGKKVNQEIDIHIKVDTGMGRIGVLVSDAFALIKEIEKLSHINIEGVFSHLARADEASGEDYTYQQLDKFKSLLDELKQAGIEIPTKHLANSAGTINYPESRFNMVRAGIITYGLLPSKEMENELDLKPVLQLKANPAYIKKLPAGYSISYGCTYTTSQPTKVATLPLGYSDGYSRLLSNKGEVLVKGERVKILGRVCMDQFMINVTGISEIDSETEIVLIGESGEEEITATELANKIGTINYEVISRIDSRITRIYLKDEEVFKVKE